MQGRVYNWILRLCIMNIDSTYRLSNSNLALILKIYIGTINVAENFS